MSRGPTELAEDLLELVPQARVERLRQLALEQPTLHRRVTELLEAGRRAPTWLEDGAFDALKDVDEDLSGTLAGGYELTAKMATGGMGSVYRARRTDQTFDREVAVKVIKRGMDSAAILRRFHRERCTLASLDHENIVTLFDAGSLADGRPYFVMEHIEGEALDQYCRSLDVGSRVRLLACICDAVQHAHSHLVIHRDLKPSNVLVTPDGVPKLLDFGIAKLLDDEPSDWTLAHESAPLTPDYASPEQLAGEPITVQSDVYSLGVLARTIFGEVLGDLRAIVRKAMREDPTERYASAAALADDLRRYLDHLPVAARKGGWYRCARALRRHWKAISLSSVVVVSLLIATVVNYQSAERAWRAQLDALSISEFLALLLDEAQPGKLGEDVELLDAIATAEARIEQSFAGKPNAEARVRMAYGLIYSRLGRHAEARPHLLRAIELIETLPDFGTGSLEWCKRQLELR